MVQLELPHVNVLTKADLCKDKQGLEGFRFPDPMEMRHELDKQVGGGWVGAGEAEQVVCGCWGEYSKQRFARGCCSERFPMNGCSTPCM